MHPTGIPENPEPHPARHSSSRGGGRGRLLRRTFLIAFLLVSGGLLSSGAVELLFRYR